MLTVSSIIIRTHGTAPSNAALENYRQSVRDQGLRHRPNSTIYQEAYHNANCNAVIQDAFLGRGTKTPYLAIFNHMGLRRDERAPKVVSDDLMGAIGPNRDVRRLEGEVESIKTSLEEKYGRVSVAPAEEQAIYTRKRGELRTARQKHRRKVFKMIYKDYFHAKDEEELQKQLQGIREPEFTRDVEHIVPQRARVADILSDMDDALSEDDIVQRKVDAINAWVAYAFVCEPVQRNQPKKRPRKTQSAIVTNKSDPVLQDASSPRGSAKVQAVPFKLPVSSPADFVQQPILPLLPKPPGTVQSRNGGCGTPDPSQPGGDHGPLQTIKNNAAPIKDEELAPPGKTAACLFCGKRYARQAKLWDHIEKHLAHARGAPIHCPRPECQSKGVVLGDVTKFKAHAARLHGSTFRRIKIVTSKSQNLDSDCCTNAPLKRRVHLITSREGRPCPPRPRIVLVSQTLNQKEAV